MLGCADAECVSVCEYGEDAFGEPWARDGGVFPRMRGRGWGEVR